MRISLCLLLSVSLLVSLLGVGCEHKYKESPLGDVSAPRMLNQKARFYIAYPLNLLAKDGPILNSGQDTKAALQTAFQRQTKNVYSGRMPETLDEAKANARKMTAHYVIYPTVMRWEDRMTEYSGRRDKVEVRLEIWDVPNDRLIDIRVIEGVSRWMTDGGDRPENLLQEPFEKYAGSLFTAPLYTPSALPQRRAQ